MVNILNWQTNICCSAKIFDQAYIYVGVSLSLHIWCIEYVLLAAWRDRMVYLRKLGALHFPGTDARVPRLFPMQPLQRQQGDKGAACKFTLQRGIG